MTNCQSPPACRTAQLRQLVTAGTALAGKPRRPGRLTTVKDVPWDAAAQAAVLAFWIAEGALLPEADVQPHQLEQQRRTRQKILQWGGKHKRHRSVAFLEDYMNRMRAAAAELAYDGNAAQLALAQADMIGVNREPAGVIGRLRAAEETLAAHGLKSASRILLIALAFRSAGALMDDRLPQLVAALAQLPVSVDPVSIVQRAPTLLGLHNIAIDPAGVIGRLRATEEALAAHGLKAVSRNYLIALASKSAGALMDDRLPQLVAALAQLPVSVDPVSIVQRAPTLLCLHNIASVLQRRVAALQRLHPQLDVGKVLRGAPSLLSYDEAKVACNWAALQAAADLDSDGIRALVVSAPSLLLRSTGPATWRLQQARTYERKRQAAKSPAPANSQEVQDPVRMRLSAISTVIRAASWRLWRLPYLASVSAFNCSVRTWVDMTPEEFEVRHGPGYSAWLLENPMPPEAFTNRGT